jgi:hypothetical protein
LAVPGRCRKAATLTSILALISERATGRFDSITTALDALLERWLIHNIDEVSLRKPDAEFAERRRGCSTFAVLGSGRGDPSEGRRILITGARYLGASSQAERGAAATDIAQRLMRGGELHWDAEAW